MRSFDRNGFSLIEVLMVISISSFIIISLLTSTLRSRIDLTGISRVVISDIRTAQANALAAKQLNGTFRCGYGIHLLTSSQASGAGLSPNTAYYLYASKDSSCGNADYNPSYSDVLLTKIVDSRVQICSNPGSDGCGLASGSSPRFEDIFFQSPSAKTYVKNKACPTTEFSQIVIRKKNVSCPSVDCTYICVYPTGKIEASSTACAASSC